MKNNNFISKFSLVVIVSSLLVLSGCNDDKPSFQPTIVPPKFFSVEVTNITNSQPMSPVAIALHQSGSFWMQNTTASLALENLAEGGDNSSLLAESFVDVGVSGTGILGPGAMQQLTIITENQQVMYLSLATMLVNTNDAFTGVSKVDVSGMAQGDSVSFRAKAYDSGTEANSEAMGTMPGPADGGEGFNAMRDDGDFVTGHPGVVTSDDGLTTSVLNQSHRFDNPVIAIKITRTQ